MSFETVRIYFFCFCLRIYLIIIIFFLKLFLLARGPDIIMEIEWPEGFTPLPQHIVSRILISDDEEDDSE